MSIHIERSNGKLIYRVSVLDSEMCDALPTILPDGHPMLGLRKVTPSSKTQLGQIQRLNIFWTFGS